MCDKQFWKAFWSIYCGTTMMFDFSLLPLAMIGAARSVPQGTPLFPVLALFGACWVLGFGFLLLVASFGVISIATASTVGDENVRMEELQSLTKEGQLLAWWSNPVGWSGMLLYALYALYCVIRFMILLKRSPEESFENGE